MAWFDRLRGEMSIDEARRVLDRAVDGAGLPSVLAAASGRIGLRRYVVRFEERGGRVRITGMEGTPLPKGGGPPAPHAFDANAVAVERALGVLRAQMPRPFTFSRGAVGVVRDGTGALSLHFRFDEDADDFPLSELPAPIGKSVPVEDPAYLKALAAWETRLAPVRARWVLPRPGETWVLEGGQLTIAGPFGERRMRAFPIATFEPRPGTFTWLLDKPAGDEAPFVEPDLEIELPSAMELAAFAAARLGHGGIFQGEIAGEKPALLLAGVRE